MRAPTPQLSLTSSVPSSRKHAFKKRKLSYIQSSTRHDTGSCPSKADQSTTPNVHKTSTLSCSSCHRVLSASMRSGAGAGAGVTCARCGSAVCAVCSRTCSSMLRQSSFPPTPALTRCPSLSGSPSPSPSGSPKRAALSLNISTMNCNILLSPSSGKRKKPSDKDDVDVDHPSKYRGTLFGPDDGALLVPGCGRPICRTCCVESVQNDGTLCVDCYAVVGNVL
ncbi:hypothetical protein DFJ58DRAFT_814456 [Suillus subalutaceus]|uniref:uncharacterized protein n=1 Tax=Suillus subalutaceus TaxID=48586 RepID=UPI001B8736CA|nr:uncharacterized protein DFJ58DRAFT_814456 [Suillus subalutaceus]KAG1838285.1 hypothetical protein DFJ58DRAFT_814456 [Suillus subalutaceus]